AILALLGLANGHMIMNTPTPYNYHGDEPRVMVHPLEDKELERPFPCQGLTRIEKTTEMTAGQPQLVNFTGGAQHGGGSCQFSLTYEFPPPVDISKWKTIYTIIGGCPTGHDGNLPEAGKDQDGRAESLHCPDPDSPRTDCIRSFNIPIPKGVPNGNATFAWTWFNKIGNREFYANCAPVSITGGSSDTTFFDSLPNMFVASIPGKPTCFDGTSGILNIPNPGRFGRVLEPPTIDTAGTCSNLTSPPVFEADGASAVPPLGNMPGPATTAQVPPPPPAAPSKLPSSTRSTAPPQPPAPAAPSTLLTFTRSSGSSASSKTASPAGRVPCTANPNGGFLVCIGETHFEICDNGLAIPQAVAAGTKCMGGVIVR
ncbi:hypothetical protein B0T14DRAFT_389117, partial [Immersiella caudata]